MLPLTKLTRKIIARLCDDVYVEKLNDPIGNKVAKLEYKEKKAYIEKKNEGYVVYYCEGDGYSWIPREYDYCSYEEAIKRAKEILR